MEEIEFIEQVITLVNNDFELEDASLQLSLDHRQKYERILVLLTAKVEALIDTDIEQLLSLLYKVDVDEAKVKQAIADQEPSLSAEIIAKMIIERELQKVATRKKYGRGSSEWIED